MKIAFGQLPLLVFLVMGLLPFCQEAYAQDTLKLSLPETEKRFLEKNLLLIASQYNISSAEALEIQARAYPNPVFSAEFNLIDPENKLVLHTGQSGQKVFGIDQLILLGGKRKTQIEIARKNKTIAGLEMEDLLRNLKWQLHYAYYSLLQQHSIIRNLDHQLMLLDTIIHSYESQAARGNIAMKEVIRLKSVYLNINNSRSDQIMAQIQNTQILQVLMQEKAPILPLMNDGEFNRFTQLRELQELVTLGQSNRPDIKMAAQTGELANLNLQLQKQMAIPDMNLIGGYDQRGGAFQNQINIGIGIPLPVWNRNKGNIKSAEFNRKFAQSLLLQKQIEAESEIQASLSNLRQCVANYSKTISLYSTDFELVFKGINENFQKRNVSLIEFIDFFESYNQSLIEFQRVRTQMALAAAQINYATATSVY